MKNLEIIQMPIEDIQPAEYNPRKITLKARKGLQRSIEKFGMVQPLVWNKRTQTLIAGHQRLVAMRDAGQATAPVVIVDISEKEEKALNISLNNPHIEGSFIDSLQDILMEISDLPEYEELELPSLAMAIPDMEDLIFDKEKPEKEEKITKCPKCGFAWQK